MYQDNAYYTSRWQLTSLFASLRSSPKTYLVYRNFGDLKGPKPERAMVDELFVDKPYCLWPERRLPFVDYMKQMAQCKFTLSPRGYGPDTYRTWEALLAGSIPIVKSSPLDTLYADLPVLIIDDWTVLTQEYLEQKYGEITSKKWSIEKLFVDYWIAQIRMIQDDFLKGYKE